MIVIVRVSVVMVFFQFFIALWSLWTRSPHLHLPPPVCITRLAIQDPSKIKQKKLSRIIYVDHGNRKNMNI